MKTEHEKKEHVNERQLVVFSLADEEFGVEIKKVNSIIKTEKITKIPNSEFFVEGVINLRGKIIVIINLHKKLGLKQKEWDKDTRIIVVELEDETVGMIVDSVREVLRIEESKIEAAPEIILQKIDSDYIQSVGILGERLIVLLDADKILHKKDLENIKDVGERAQQGKIAEVQGRKDEEVSSDNYFWFNNGKAVKNMGELISDLNSIDSETFKHHVNSDKNDLAEWIKHVLKNEGLADQLRGKTDRNEIINILNNAR